MNLTALPKTKNHIGYQNRKTLVFFTKTENQMLKNEKSANRNDHQNRKTEVFRNKNRKTDLKNSQNRKTENPNVPLLFQLEKNNLAEFHKFIIINLEIEHGLKTEYHQMLLDRILVFYQK